MTIRFLKLSLASPESIRSWTERTLSNGKKVGKILKGDLIDYKNGLPIRDGLRCERIFGPIVSFTCSCGRYKCIETRGIHIIHDYGINTRGAYSSSGRQDKKAIFRRGLESNLSGQDLSETPELAEGVSPKKISSEDIYKTNVFSDENLTFANTKNWLFPEEQQNNTFYMALQKELFLQNGSFIIGSFLKNWVGASLENKHQENTEDMGTISVTNPPFSGTVQRKTKEIPSTKDLDSNMPLHTKEKHTDNETRVGQPLSGTTELAEGVPPKKQNEKKELSLFLNSNEIRKKFINIDNFFRSKGNISFSMKFPFNRYNDYGYVSSLYSEIKDIHHEKALYNVLNLSKKLDGKICQKSPLYLFRLRPIVGLAPSMGLAPLLSTPHRLFWSEQHDKPNFEAKQQGKRRVRAPNYLPFPNNYLEMVEKKVFLDIVRACPVGNLRALRWGSPPKSKCYLAQYIMQSNEDKLRSLPVGDSRVRQEGPSKKNKPLLNFFGSTPSASFRVPTERAPSKDTKVFSSLLQSWGNPKSYFLKKATDLFKNWEINGVNKNVRSEFTLYRGNPVSELRSPDEASLKKMRLGATSSASSGVPSGRAPKIFSLCLSRGRKGLLISKVYPDVPVPLMSKRWAGTQPWNVSNDGAEPKRILGSNPPNSNHTFLWQDYVKEKHIFFLPSETGVKLAPIFRARPVRIPEFGDRVSPFLGATPSPSSGVPMGRAPNNLEKGELQSKRWGRAPSFAKKNLERVSSRVNNGGETLKKKNPKLDSQHEKHLSQVSRGKYLSYGKYFILKSTNYLHLIPFFRPLGSASSFILQQSDKDGARPIETPELADEVFLNLPKNFNRGLPRRYSEAHRWGSPKSRLIKKNHPVNLTKNHFKWMYHFAPQFFTEQYSGLNPFEESQSKRRSFFHEKFYSGSTQSFGLFSIKKKNDKNKNFDLTWELADFFLPKGARNIAMSLDDYNTKRQSADFFLPKGARNIAMSLGDYNTKRQSAQFSLFDAYLKKRDKHIFLPSNTREKFALFLGDIITLDLLGKEKSADKKKNETPKNPGFPRSNFTTPSSDLTPSFSSEISQGVEPYRDENTKDENFIPGNFKMSRDKIKDTDVSSDYPSSLEPNPFNSNQTTVDGEVGIKKYPIYKFKNFPPGKKISYCPHCEVELLPSSIRRYRLGYIEFVSPVAHIWYTSNSIPLLLNLSKTLIEGIAECHEALSSGFPPINTCIWSYNGSEPISWTFQNQLLRLPINLSSSAFQNEIQKQYPKYIATHIIPRSITGEQFFHLGGLRHIVGFRPIIEVDPSYTLEQASGKPYFRTERQSWGLPHQHSGARRQDSGGVGPEKNKYISRGFAYNENYLAGYYFYYLKLEQVTSECSPTFLKNLFFRSLILGEGGGKLQIRGFHHDSFGNGKTDKDYLTCAYIPPKISHLGFPQVYKNKRETNFSSIQSAYIPLSVRVGRRYICQNGT